jgi:hypothetical protein
MTRSGLVLLAVLAGSLVASPAAAGFTDTAPQGLFVLESRMAFSRIAGHWNGEGELGTLIEPVELYEPGGGLQGRLVPEVDARLQILISMLLYGITDDLTLFVGVPLVLRTHIIPDLNWIPGDYSPQLGRPYSEDDFWEWAASMGQPKPGPWEARNVLSDIVVGTRWRFSDRLGGMPDGLHLAVSAFGALPTGIHPDPEEIVATGTSSWNLHAQGELGLHLSADYRFPGRFDDRLTLGLDVFYEAFLPRTYVSSTGEIHPLLLNHRPYVGETYRVNPGDFFGAEIAAWLVAIRGPALQTWLTRAAPEMAESLPPLLSLSAAYNFTAVGQSRWYSESAIWNWENERFWAPGYKNILFVGANVSLLRLGVPLDLYVNYRNLTLLPGRNVRAPNIFFAGARVPVKFW